MICYDMKQKENVMELWDALDENSDRPKNFM